MRGLASLWKCQTMSHLTTPRAPSGKIESSPSRCFTWSRRAWAFPAGSSRSPAVALSSTGVLFHSRRGTAFLATFSIVLTVCAAFENTQLPWLWRKGKLGGLYAHKHTIKSPAWWGLNDWNICIGVMYVSVYMWVCLCSLDTESTDRFASIFLILCDLSWKSY